VKPTMAQAIIAITATKQTATIPNHPTEFLFLNLSPH
jgi:hypothetical protein